MVIADAMPAVMGVGDLAWHPNGRPSPELVPAEVLCADADDWVGKPVTLGHPEGNRVTQADWHGLTDTPVVGRIAAAHAEDGKLKGEVLLFEQRRPLVEQNVDPAKPVMDVSICVTASTDPSRKGMDAKGRAYEGAWTRIGVRDHLALLPESKGACSTSMGAGFPRAAQDGGSMSDLKQKAADPKSVKPDTDAVVEPSFEDRLKPILEPLHNTITKLADSIKELAGRQDQFDRIADDFACREQAKREELAGQLIACKLYEDSDRDNLAKRSIESLEREVRAAQHGVPATGFPPVQSTLAAGPPQRPKDHTVKVVKGPTSFSGWFDRKQAAGGGS